MSSRSVIRYFSCAKNLRQTLPSTGEMKTQEWIASTESTTDSKSAIFNVVQSAKNLQKTNKEPPLNIIPRFTKKFEPGQTYDPFDFTMDKLAMEQRMQRQEVNKNKSDPFERSGINPLDLYTMPEILSRFLTSTGQILPRDVTGCSSENQKKLAMSIKRARSTGLLSSVHKHARFLPARNL